MQVLSLSILFAVATPLYANAIDDRSILDTANFETMARHEMLHSTRRLTLEDVQSMSIFAELDRKKQSSNPKIGPSLRELIADHDLGLVTKDYHLNHGLIVYHHGGSITVLVEVVGDTVENIEEVLTKNGFKVLSCYKHMCSMYASIDDITKLVRMPQVIRIHAPMPSFQERSESIDERHNRRLQGSVTSEGVIAHKIDKARAKYNVNGTGILICSLSTSFNCLNGAANDTLSGDLPPSSRLNIIKDLNSTECVANRATDPGRALLQVAYDVAPGARFAFHAADTTTSFVQAMRAFASVGCDIIFETLAFIVEPWFLDGPLAQVVDDVIAQGISYFTIPSRFTRGAAWDAPSGFVPSGISPPNSTGQFHRFGNTSNGSPIISQRIGIPNTGSISDFEAFILQWDQPFFQVSGPPGCQSDLDFICSTNGTVLFSGTESNIGNEPVEAAVIVPALTGLTNRTIFCDLFIIHKSGPFPTYMKIISTESAPVYEFPTNTTTIVGKGNSALVTSVERVYIENSPLFNVTPPRIKDERSSFGIGNPVLFDRSGNRTLLPRIRKPLRFRALLNASTTTSRNVIFSAAHVAGIAALMLQAKGGPKSLTPQQVANFLELSAIDMDDPFTPGFDVGYDNATGFGFVNALGALDAATATKSPTKVPTKRPTMAPTTNPTKAPTKNPTKRPTEAPTKLPTKVPTGAPIKNQPCGFLRLSIFCPLSDTGCGLFKRIFRIGGC